MGEKIRNLPHTILAQQKKLQLLHSIMCLSSRCSGSAVCKEFFRNLVLASSDWNHNSNQNSVLCWNSALTSYINYKSIAPPSAVRSVRWGSNGYFLFTILANIWAQRLRLTNAFSECNNCMARKSNGNQWKAIRTS